MRNYVQCLQDFGIRLQLSRTVVDIRGDRRVEAVLAADVDAHWGPIPGTEELIPCDTLLLSVGLTPENELSRQAGVLLDRSTGGPCVDERWGTSVPGIFAAGNVVHVCDLVDDVSRIGDRAGAWAAEFALGKTRERVPRIPLRAGRDVRYIVPQSLDPESLLRGEKRLHMRARRPIERPVNLLLEAGGAVVVRRRLRYVRPGEMIGLSLPTSAYARVKSSPELWAHIEETNG
jgi:hypothetical protein